MIADLFSLIKDRKEKRPKKSYTTSLFNKGLSEIIRKVGEESIEVIVAAQSETKQRLIEESGDLLYHLMVLLVEKGVDLGDITKELIKRYNKN